MEKTSFKKLYDLIIISLYFSCVLMLIKISLIQWFYYPMIYDILSICCGFLSAIILTNCSIFKAICAAVILFIIYFLFFKVFISVMIVTLCAFMLQVISLYMRNKLKILVILLCLGVILFLIYYKLVGLTFLLQFILWWHSIWFIFLYIIFLIKNKYMA